MTGAHSSRALSPLPRSAGLLAAWGVCVAALWPGSADWRLVGVMATVALIAVVLRWPRVAIASAAATVFMVLAVRHAESCWPATQTGARVRAVVQIDSLLTRRDAAIEFDADVTVLEPASLRRTLRARITWRAPPQPWPAPGEHWQLLLRMSAPASHATQDFARIALRDGIDARASVIASRLDRRLARAEDSVLVWRARIESALHELTAGREAAALFAGLAVGATGAISREQWQVYSATGITHLVAISGMHVTLFAWLVAALARGAWRYLPGLALRIERERFAGIAGVLAALMYGVFAGLGIPTQRTLVMLALWWWAKLSGREQRGYEVLSLAALAILLLDPLAPLSSGFWLSFVAMATLLSSDLSLAPAQRRWWHETFVTQWRVTLALVPVTLAWFSSFSLAGLLANIVAIPVFSFVLVPLVLLATALQWFATPLAAAFLAVATWVHDLIWPLLRALAAQPLANVTVQDDPRLWSVLMLVAILWSLPVPWRWRAASVACLLPWAWPSRAAPAAGVAAVDVLAAGDGVAVVIRTQTHTVLYETGEVYGSAGRRAHTLLWPHLRAHGVSAIDLLVLGSAGVRNVAGVATLARLLPIEAIRAGGTWRDPPPRVGACLGRERWEWDGVTFELQAASVQPAASCVLRIRARGAPALLLAERIDALEARELAADPAARDVDVLLAPRRGSIAAAAPALVAAARPRVLIVSAARVEASRRTALAQHWQLPEACIVTTADGAIRVELAPQATARIAQPKAARRPGLWRPEPAVGYDSASSGAEAARCGN